MIPAANVMTHKATSGSIYAIPDSGRSFSFRFFAWFGK
jgi:hypothetical protein